MKCHRHPSMEYLKGKRLCTLCEDGAPLVEADRRSSMYELMSQHVEPGVRGIRTKRQYQRLLKRHGLTDDVSPKQMRRFVLYEAKPKRERVLTETVNQITQKMFGKFTNERMHQTIRTEKQHQLKQRLTQLLSR